MHRSKITIDFHQNLILYDFDLEHSNLVSPNIVDPLCVEVHTDSDGHPTDMFFNSDVTLLFNQKRLEDTLGRDGLKKFFDSFASRSTALTQLRSKISDSDLARICKSRYLQSPSEILAWSQYLDANYKDLLQSVQSDSVSESDTTDTNVDSSGNVSDTK